MPTKTELLAEIESLQKKISAQAKILNARHYEETVVRLPSPGWEHNTKLTHAPTIKQGGKDSWVAKVMPVLFGAVRKVGVPIDSRAGLWGDSELTLNEGGRGDSYVVPRLVADCLTELINRAGDFGCDCYQAGYKDGGNLLHQLAQGEITPERFEDTRARELSIENQNSYRRLRVRNFEG